MMKILYGEAVCIPEMWGRQSLNLSIRQTMKNRISIVGMRGYKGMCMCFCCFKRQVFSKLLNGSQLSMTTFYFCSNIVFLSHCIIKNYSKITCKFAGTFKAICVNYYVRDNLLHLNTLSVNVKCKL